MQAVFDEDFLPYQYPVAALLVDDDASLLCSLTAGLSRERRIFSAPCGKDAIASYRRRPAVRHRFMHRSGDQTGFTEHNVTVDTAGIASLMDKAERHQEIGLVVVDYKMPGLNGVEVCEALRDEPCRRILLTGMADEQIAVRAFNLGLIHQFIRKDHKTLERLGEAMRYEQRRYFHQVSRGLTEGLRDRLGAFEHEPAVREALQTLLDQLDVAEYYLCTQPNGLLVLDRTGRRRRILVQSEQERRSALEIIGATGTEEHLLGAMVYAEPATATETSPEVWIVQPQMRIETPAGRYLLSMEEF